MKRETSTHGIATRVLAEDQTVFCAGVEFLFVERADACNVSPRSSMRFMSCGLRL